MDKVFNMQLLKQAKKYENLIPIFFISFIGTVAFSQIEQIIALFIEAVWVQEDILEEEKIKMAARYTGYYLTIIGVVAAIIQGGLIGRLNKRFGEVRLIQVGLVVIMTAIAMIPLIGMTKSFALLLISGPYLALGTSILNPSKSSLISRSIPTQLQGTMLGLNQSFSSLGRVIGPSIAGFLFEISLNIPFYVGAGMMLPAIWWSLSLRTPHEPSEKSYPAEKI